MVDTQRSKISLDNIQGLVDRIPRGIPLPMNKSAYTTVVQTNQPSRIDSLRRQGRSCSEEPAKLRIATLSGEKVVQSHSLGSFIKVPSSSSQVKLSTRETKSMLLFVKRLVQLTAPSHPAQVQVGNSVLLFILW